MNNNRTPFGVALISFILTFFLSFLLFWMMPLLSEGFWLALWEGEGPFLPSLLLALLVGFLIWLNLKLSVYDATISDLRYQIRSLEEKLDNMKKD